MSKLMAKQNCGIIYAIKRCKYETIERSIAEYMSQYTGTPVEYYTKFVLYKILVNAIADLLNTMDNPGSFWYEYQHWKIGLIKYDDFKAICAALATVQVRDDNDNYINGFRPVEEYKEFGL